MTFRRRRPCRTGDAGRLAELQRQASVEGRSQRQQRQKG